MATTTECRTGCGACCIVPSISSEIPGMPMGKPAGVRCIQLSEDHACKLFGSPLRPDVCHQFKPASDVCGASADEARNLLGVLEVLTS